MLEHQPDGREKSFELGVLECRELLFVRDRLSDEHEADEDFERALSFVIVERLYCNIELLDETGLRDLPNQLFDLLDGRLAVGSDALVKLDATFRRG